MIELLKDMFDASPYPQRWTCGAWTPTHGWIHIVSDVAIWGAYMTIPLVLIYLVRRQKNVPFPAIFWLFGAFILACGTGHLIEAGLFYWPVYRLSGAVKLITALISWTTVIALVPVIPKALAMRSADELEAEVTKRTRELEETNRKLQAEIVERKQLEKELEKHRYDLEGLVEKRTGQLQQEIAEREKLEVLARAREAQMSLFVEHTPAAVAMFDREMRYMVTSRRWLEDYNLGDRNIIGLSHYEVFPEIDAAELKAIHQRCLAGAVEKCEEDRFPRGDGTVDWVRWEIHPWPRNDNEIGGIIMFTELITQRKHAEEEREHLLDTVKEKNRELQQIVHVTSHDLRSPLVNIQGFSKELMTSCQKLDAVLASDEISYEAQSEISLILQEDIPESLQIIQTSTAKMDSLLRGLLKLSRFGRAALHIAKLNMDKLISNIAETFEFQMREADVAFELAKLPACYGDETQINQVFSNLIGNALKYLDPNRRGKIKVSGFTEKDRSIYCVEDNGMGIPQDQQQKIFEIFHRLDLNNSPGEGLGLTIVHKILERHEGSIWIESAPEEGSKFYVSLSNENFEPLGA